MMTIAAAAGNGVSFGLDSKSRNKRNHHRIDCAPAATLRYSVSIWRNVNYSRKPDSKESSRTVQLFLSGGRWQEWVDVLRAKM